MNVMAVDARYMAIDAGAVVVIGWILQLVQSEVIFMPAHTTGDEVCIHVGGIKERSGIMSTVA